MSPHVMYSILGVSYTFGFMYCVFIVLSYLFSCLGVIYLLYPKYFSYSFSFSSVYIKFILPHTTIAHLQSLYVSKLCTIRSP